MYSIRYLDFYGAPCMSQALLGSAKDPYRSAPRNSLEILPGGLPEWEETPLPEHAPKFGPEFPFILVEGNLGIPKKVLYAIYLSAVSISLASSDPQVAEAVSSIVILANPAHQTAFNTRKKLILGGHLDPQKELALCELLARGSPEFGKQSIVWAHRRWCFSQIYGVIGPSERPVSPLPGWASSEEMRLFPRLSPASVEHELRIIQRTCETYPRNYHAWAHWHHIMDICYAIVAYIPGDASSRFTFSEIIGKEYERLRDWINLHISDYSAMYQLSQAQSLLKRLSSEGNIAMVVEDEAAVEHPLALVSAFPSHESLWMYLRITLGRVEVEKRNATLLSPLLQDQFASNTHATRLRNWLCEHEAPDLS